MAVKPCYYGNIKARKQLSLIIIIIISDERKKLFIYKF